MELARRWGIAEDGTSVEIALFPTLIAELEKRWPKHGLRPSQHPFGTVEARFGLSNNWMIVPDREASEGNPSKEAWDHLETELALFAVHRLTHLVPIHAAAIATRGRVLIVPGEPMAGKSTLAIAAHKVGASVLSDEYTLVDPNTGLVLGWPRPVRKRNPDGTVDLLDIAVENEPLPPGIIAILRYQPGQSSWRRVTPAASVIQTLSHTLTTRSRPADSFTAISRICERATSIKGIRGEADTAITELLALLE